jgi:hypothetical protein
VTDPHPQRYKIVLDNIDWWFVGAVLIAVVGMAALITQSTDVILVFFGLVLLFVLIFLFKLILAMQTKEREQG